MTKEEFEEIIKPLWLIDNKTHREFLMQSITGNFNRWNESKVKNLSSNTVLAVSLPQKLQEIIDNPREDGYWVKGELRKLLSGNDR